MSSFHSKINMLDTLKKTESCTMSWMVHDVMSDQTRRFAMRALQGKLWKAELSQWSGTRGNHDRVLVWILTSLRNRPASGNFWLGTDSPQPRDVASDFQADEAKVTFHGDITPVRFRLIGLRFHINITIGQYKEQLGEPEDRSVMYIEICWTRTAGD